MSSRPALLLLLALASCRQGGGDRPLAPPSVPAYAAPLPPWPPAVATARIGRGVAPARALPEPIAWGLAVPPILVDRVWQVPGDGEALAVVSGSLGGRAAIELVAIDEGRVRWRDSVDCQAPVVHVTREVILCAGADQLAAVEIATGEQRWRQPLRFTGAEGDLAVGVRGAAVVVVSAATGTIVAEAVPPAGIEPATVRRACATAGGVTMWAWTDALSRYAITAGTSGAAETLKLSRPPVRVDACGAPALIEVPVPDSVEGDLVAIAPDRLRAAGPPVRVRGFWRGEGDRVVVATARGIEVRDATLAPVSILRAAEVGGEITSRGRRRLVRGGGGLPVLLEDDLPIAYLSAPMNAGSIALGDGFVVGGFAHVQRFRLPAIEASSPALPAFVVGDPPEPSIPARDLPPALDLSATGSIDQPGADGDDVAVVAFAPDDPALLLTSVGPGVAAFDLRARRWRWHAPDACAGDPVAVAVARDTIVCGSRGEVRAIGREDGATRWTWQGSTVDGVAAAGGLVVVATGGGAVLVDAATGVTLGQVTADDGDRPRVIPLALGDVDAVVGVERGQVVARLPRASMLPVWAVAVDGAVVGIGVAGDRVAVELAGGEMYLLDRSSGTAIAAGGWARRWRVPGAGDLVLSEPAAPPGPEWHLTAYGDDGVTRFAAGLAVEPPWLVGPRGRDPAAPLALAFGPDAGTAALLDPRTGRVTARLTLPARAAPGAVFATVVDGSVVAGAVLSRPLGIVLFPR